MSTRRVPAAHGRTRRGWSLAAGLVGLLGCTRDNPAFDPYAVSETSETSATGPLSGSESGGAGSTSESGEAESTSESGEAESTSESGETETETETGDPPCEAPLAYVDCDGQPGALTETPWLALGLDCPGNVGATIPAADPVFAAVDTASWRIASAFGTAAGPNFGDRLWAARPGALPDPEGEVDVPPNTSTAILLLSTGVLPPANDDGAVLLPPGSQVNLGLNLNPGTPLLPLPPAPINPALGSNAGLGGDPFVDCAIGKDCSDSLYEAWIVQNYDEFHDKLWMRFTVVPPAGVHSFVLDVALLSSEFPDYVDQPNYADSLVVWASSDSFTGNLAFAGGEPLSAHSLDSVGALVHHGPDEPALDGTGFEGHGASAWLELVGPVEPLEPVQLTLFLADLEDPARATVALIDNFRWRCTGCEPGTCGLGL